MSLMPPDSPNSMAETPQNTSQGNKFQGQDRIEEINKVEEVKELVDWAKKQHTKAKTARSSIERQWRLNLAFYFGKQNVAVQMKPGLKQGQLYTPKAPPYRVRSVTNKIRPIIRTEYARVTSNKPSASVVPASSEDRDLFAAQAAEQIWQSEFSVKKLQSIYGRAAWWMLITGNGFLKDWWDPDKENTNYALANEVQIENLNRGQEQMMAVGDTCYSPVTPFHLFVPELREPEIENQPFVLNVFVKSVEWAKATYGEDFKPDTISSNDIIQDSDLNIHSGSNEPDSVLVTEVWLKPNAHKFFPKGGYFCTIGNRLVAINDDGIPYQHGEFPFTHFSHIPSGSFYRESVITDLILPQREYNRTRSQIIESKNRMAKPQLVAPKGTIDPQKITSEPGIVIEYNPGFGPPAPLPLQPIPAYVHQDLDIITRDMEDISAQHQVSRGEAPGSGVTAATAISYLQEKDDSLMTHTYNSIDEGWEKIAKHTLSHVVQYWELPRVVRTTGMDSSFDAIVLKGADIRSGTDIRIEPGSSLPVSKAARQAFIMDMMKMGFVDPNKGLELMEIGGTQRLYEELKVDERQAQRENLRIQMLDPQEILEYKEQQMQQFMQQAEISNMFAGAMAGEPEGFTDMNTGMLAPPPQNIIPVNSWDNHALHIEVHNKFRKTQTFERLDDLIKEQFEAHVRAHANALNSAAMGAQMMDPMATGMPPEMDQITSQGMEGMPEMDPSQMMDQSQNGGGAANQFGPAGGQEGMG